MNPVCRRVLFLSLLGFGGWATTAFAEPIVLKFATASPPTSGFIKNVFEPWASTINAAGGDQLKVQVFNGFALANRINAYERTMTDVIQIGYSGPSEAQGRYPLAGVVNLPFVSTNSEAASVAFWRIYADGTLAEEFKDVHPLALGVFTKALPHFNKKEVRKIEDMRGLKIRVSDSVGSEVIQALGAASTEMGSTDVYKALEAGTISGTLISWGAITALKMTEVTTWHIDVPLVSSDSWIIMSKKKFDSLPAGARKILDAHTGEVFSRRFGAYHEQLTKEARAEIAASKAHTIYKLPPEEEKRWIQATDPVIADFVKNTRGADKALKAYRAAFAEAEKSLKNK